MMDILQTLSDQALPYVGPMVETAADWLKSPAAWSQFALLLAAWFVARFITHRSTPRLRTLLTPAMGSGGTAALVQVLLRGCLPLLMPLLAYVLTAIGEEMTRSLFGSGAVIALGKRVFLFIAARILVQEVLDDRFLRMMGRYVLLPIMALYVVGLLGPLGERLGAVRIDMGEIEFSAMALVRGAIAGALLFWASNWSNRHSENYIKKQEELRPATRELASKAAQVSIFSAAFLLLMSIMGINLSGIVLLGGALGVGIGLGLQQIAANFVSGVILLIEGQTTVGDYVELDDGSAGTIIRMTARACILETIDGRWVVVPNENFITSRVVNYSDAGTAHRYEIEFRVAYGTDLNRIPRLIEPAVAALPFTLSAPKEPECELRDFAESGVVFGVEFWVNGIEDLTMKFESRVRFAVWEALRSEGIEIPYPRQTVDLVQSA